jgi:FdhD protein
METKICVRKVSTSGWKDSEDHLAVEEPLEIQLHWTDHQQTFNKKIAVTMRTPGHDNELAAGFVFTEGIVKNGQHISTIDQLPAQQRVVVNLQKGEQPDLSQAERNFYTTSSCGVCGKQNLEDIQTASAFSTVVNKLVVDSDVFLTLEQNLLSRQNTFNATGGIHAAALFHSDGRFVTMREDVGRHNALDKVIGAALIGSKLPLSETILLLSGRASFELIQKAFMAGISIIAAVGAPSSLAVSHAETCGITLIGFLRQGKFNIYSKPERVQLHALV